MKILHTSDWHLGRNLYSYKRTGEFQSFLNWMTETIVRENIDILLISGDIFDTSIVSNESQKMYYRFLCSLIGKCRHVVVTAGNHDSASFIDAPAEILGCLNVHVVGQGRANPADEVLELRDEQGKTELIVCATPFLREAEVRNLVPEEERDGLAGLRNGFAARYGICAARVDEIRAKAGADVPAIAMGHLMVSGTDLSQNEGMREIYVGTIEGVDAGIFPNTFDYVALGHIHRPQIVAHQERIQYSGSPLPMGFGEAKQQKHVCIIEFKGRNPVIAHYPIPCFQKLVSISGDVDEIKSEIRKMARTQECIWLEANYTGKEIAANFYDTVNAEVKDTPIELVHVQNRAYTESVAGFDTFGEELEDIDDLTMFKYLLDCNRIPESERNELLATYAEAVSLVHDDQHE